MNQRKKSSSSAPETRAASHGRRPLPEAFPPAIRNGCGVRSSAAWNGQGASPETLHVLNDHEVDLSGHASRAVTLELVEEATDIYTMTESHLAAMLANFPEHADKIRLVTCYTDNRNISDPIGCGQAAYNNVARQLTDAIRAIIARMEQEA